MGTSLAAAPEYGAPAPPVRRPTRGRRLAVVACACLALAGAGYLADLAINHPMRSVALPERAAGLVRLHDGSVDRVATRMTSLLDPTDFRDPAVGGYAATPGGKPTTLLLVATHDRVRDPTASLDDVAAGFRADLARTGTTTMTELRTVDAGTLGGAMACTSLTVTTAPGRTSGVCFWLDAGTIGEVVTQTADLDRAAETTRAMREDAES